MRQSKWLVIALFLLPGCDDGGDPVDPVDPGRPDPDPVEAGVTATLDATYQRTDSTLLVNGTEMFEFPNIDRAIRVERFHHLSFGSSGARTSDTWWIFMLHQDALIQRNDSTILSYVDHGDVIIQDVVTEKSTTEPGVGPDDKLGFDSFYSYRQPLYSTVTWPGGNVSVFEDAPYYTDVLGGAEISVETTGASGVPAAEGSFTPAPIAALVAVESGEPIDLAVDEPPVVQTTTSLVLEFDDPLDPARAWIFVYPNYPAVPGARSAFLQPESAAERVAVPASLLAALVEDAGTSPVPYRIVIHEYYVQADALTGTAHGEPFSLPLFQWSETTLDVMIAR